jgi:hydrogenase nickel incorporation protein HypA/HybF
MHELSIALSLLDLAAEQAECQHARVVAIHLKLGPLAGVVPEALRSAYELARTGSDLADAELLIEEVPVVAYCPACAAERTLPSIQEFACPVCGTPPARLISGRELELVGLEVES